VLQRSRRLLRQEESQNGWSTWRPASGGLPHDGGKSVKEEKASAAGPFYRWEREKGWRQARTMATGHQQQAGPVEPWRGARSVVPIGITRGTVGLNPDPGH
jgi:hypothetical protein